MNMIDATTGHNRQQERSVAKVLYIALVVAVLAGMLFFFFVGQKRTMNPTIRHETAPAATPSDSATGSENH